MRYLVLIITILTTAGAASAAAVDAPKRKSGLWEIRMSNAGAQGTTMQQCIDQSTDDLMKNNMAGMEKPSCSKNEMRRDGDKIITESVCKVGTSTATTRAVFTGRFDTAYKADIKSTYDPPLHGMKESASVIDAKWVGACKPGQKAGEISMPGMPNINMNDMMKKLPKQP